MAKPAWEVGQAADTVEVLKVGARVVLSRAGETWMVGWDALALLAIGLFVVAGLVRWAWGDSDG